MRTKDITNKIINTSIDFKFNYNDENFYTTFYSLNKLLYFAQKQMIKKYNRCIIDSEIIANSTGPFIEETKEIFYKYTYEKIKEKQKEEIALPPSVNDIIFNVVQQYGSLSDQEIGLLSKREKAYQEAILNKKTNIITESLIKETILVERPYIKTYKK